MEDSVGAQQTVARIRPFLDRQPAPRAPDEIVREEEATSIGEPVVVSHVPASVLDLVDGRMLEAGLWVEGTLGGLDLHIDGARPRDGLLGLVAAHVDIHRHLVTAEANVLVHGHGARTTGATIALTLS
jgi:hypothetical protein